MEGRPAVQGGGSCGRKGAAVEGSSRSGRISSYRMQRREKCEAEEREAVVSSYHVL